MRVFLWKARELSTLIVLLLRLRTDVPTEPTMGCQGPLGEPGRPRILSCGPGSSGPRSASCTDCHSIPNAVRASLTDQTSSKRVIISSVFGTFSDPLSERPRAPCLRRLPGSGLFESSRLWTTVLEQPLYAIMGTTRSPYRTVVAIVFVL